MTAPQQPNGWASYQELVLYRLNDMSRRLDLLTTSMTRMETEVTSLKVRAGLWGAIAGAIPALLGALLLFLKG